MESIRFALPALSPDLPPAFGEELLRRLCLAFGPTGAEEEVAEVILEYVRPLSDKILRDSMGNLLCRMRLGAGDEARPVMIAAHMDEVGMMVTEICEDGTLHFENLGGIHGSVLEGRRVMLRREGQTLSGLIASKPIHQRKKKERLEVLSADRLYIDIGAASREEAEALVSVGTPATFCSDFYRFGSEGRMVKSKALDDRMGCASMILVMEALRKDPPGVDADLWFCFTVREEIGLSGAKVAAQRLGPALAIVLECTAVADLPDVEAHSRVATVGKGGTLSLMDRSTVYDRDLVTAAKALAEARGIPVQLKQFVSGGNDAGAIHKSGVGVPTLALSVPTRYLHSPACVASLSDFESVTRLTEAMLRDLDSFRKGE